jgi:hypothetical protein
MNEMNISPEQAAILDEIALEMHQAEQEVDATDAPQGPVVTTEMLEKELAERKKAEEKATQEQRAEQAREAIRMAY